MFGLRSRLRKELGPLGEFYLGRSKMAREWDLPRQWIVCPACGEQDWVMPPHGLNPCPLAVQMAEQLGLKFDAERMASVRIGVGFEEVARQLRPEEDEDGA